MLRSRKPFLVRDDVRRKPRFIGKRTQSQTEEHYRLVQDRVRFAVYLQEPLCIRVMTRREDMVAKAAELVMKAAPRGGSRIFVLRDLHGYYRIERGRNDWQEPMDVHRVGVTKRWLGMTRRLGTAIVGRHLLLDGNLFVEAGTRSVWSVRAARPGRGCNVVVETGFVSSYGPNDITFHRTVQDALGAQPSPILVEIQRPLSVEDYDALSSLIPA